MRLRIVLCMVAAVSVAAAGCGRRQAHEETAGPVEGMAHLERGYAFIQRGEYPRAMEDLVVAAQLMPDSTLPLMAIGQVSEVLGQYQQAVECYRQALAIDPNIALANFKIGFISRAVRGDDKTALARFTRAVELDSTNATYAFQLADLYHDSERFAEAKKYFEKAIALDPDHAYAHYGLGEIFDQHMDQPEKGYSEYEKAIAIAPEDANLRLMVGKAYAERGRRTEAVRHLTEFLRLAPNSPEADSVETLIRRLERSKG
jgi:tetratricopeptide (TPR) repeat protein